MMNWQDLAMVGLLLAAEALSNVGSFSVETEEQVMSVSPYRFRWVHCGSSYKATG